VNDLRCKKAVLGGTFSLLHEGHKHFLSKAIESASELVIGISSDTFIAKLSKNHPVEDYESRAVRVLLFCLNYVREGQRVYIFPLDDRYGPATKDPELDCIVLSEENRRLLKKINKIRALRGLKPLKAIVVNLLKIKGGVKLSSTLLWRLSLGEHQRCYVSEHKVPD